MRWWLGVWIPDSGFPDLPAGGVFALVAGEEARSREAREHAEVAARHLVPLRTALRAGNAMCTGCGNEGRFHHGPVPLG
ncbi:MAG TPA: hypothetical protein VHW70_10520 [Edaphobacter sp.]|nr:hypothetical protein [Edaphobacter sp.]